MPTGAKQLIKSFQHYLLIEQSLSKNTAVNYARDIEKLALFVIPKSLLKLEEHDLRLFIQSLNEVGLSATTQNRITSGVRSFYQFLKLEELVEKDPSELLESAKTRRKIPETLSNQEIEQLIEQIDLSTEQGERNKAIIEVLYGCGLRVSECTSLKLTDIFFDDEFIRVIGKGDKQRLVPIGNPAKHQIARYVNEVRVHQVIKPDSRDILFLNRRGSGLSRVMVFNIIKDLVIKAGIKKQISPHTLRHSFASELVNRGADLRAVQAMLGHESITTTEIYTHVNNAELRDAIIQYHPRS